MSSTEQIIRKNKNWSHSLQVTHFLQNDIQGAQVLEIPVNMTDTNIHVKIQGDVDQATITTPIGG